MRRPSFLLLFIALGLTGLSSAQERGKGQGTRVGIIGLDTSHSPAFAKALNDPQAGPELGGYRVVAAYPHGSRDIESSTSRIPRYTEEFRGMGVEIVDSVDALLSKVDVVLLETNDGRPHLEQALAVFKAGKPVFIDKPIAGSLADAVAIFEAARHYRVPVFSCSSLRFGSSVQQIRAGELGQVLQAFTYSPASLEPTHPDLFWYGIHGVEALFTVMGKGCRTVVRIHTEEADLVAGTWEGGRVGTFLGVRQEKSGYGGTVFGSDAIGQIGSFEGYRPLIVEIVRFFQTGVAPVSEEETLEVFAFMEAADESKRSGGKPVELATVLEQARKQAARRWK